MALRRINQIKKVILLESLNVITPPADFSYELKIELDPIFVFTLQNEKKMIIILLKLPWLSCKNEQHAAVNNLIT